MLHDFNFASALRGTARTWLLDDVLAPDQVLDFTRTFMPDSLARTAGLTGLDSSERQTLNQIRGHEYLCIFGLVEEFILPFVLDHARPRLRGDDYQVRALIQFAAEEAKHIHLFKRFHAAFAAGFPVACQVIGPADEIAAQVLGHDTLSVALLILHLEWMTQSHYLGSVRDDGDLDPLFKSLLKHHWIEEAQHAKLDTLMVETLADGRDEASIDAAIDGYLAITAFLDGGLETQAWFNVDALERAIGKTFAAPTRARYLRQQHQSARWTYLGSGMAHPKFRATVGAISPSALARIDAVAPTFA